MLENKIEVLRNDINLIVKNLKIDVEELIKRMQELKIK